MDSFSNDAKIFDENAEILKALAHPIRHITSIAVNQSLYSSRID